MNKRIEYLKQKVHSLTTKPGVYKMLDEYGNIIYIGKAKNLKNRVSSYFLNTQKQEKVAQMVSCVFDFDYIVTTSELEALNVECNLIHKFMPFYNIMLKDGKAFPYLKIDIKNPYPKIEITRKVKKDNNLYFGPYFGEITGSGLYKLINNTFKLKDCNITSTKARSCLNYQIGTCLGPCIGAVTPEEYGKEVKKVINFLKGDLSYAKKVLNDKMKLCAENQLFEKAMEYRDNLKSIDVLQKRVITELAEGVDIDVFGYASSGVSSVITLLLVRGGKMMGLNNYNVVDASLNVEDVLTNFITQYYMQAPYIPNNVVVSFNNNSLSEWLNNLAGKSINLICPLKGIKKKLLNLAEINAQEDLKKSVLKDTLYTQKTIGAMEQLQSLLHLKKLPRRIEGYDISNISGTNTVASMVVFSNGITNKKHYRKFALSTIGPNDFESMKEVITRRIKELKGNDISFSQIPDLILIDGGKGQLGYAYNVLKENSFDCDIVSLAKREEEVYIPNISQPVIISKSNYGLKLLQNVRDESHRFAITFHRSKRKTQTLSSTLLKIDGVGETTSKVLFKHFKSLDNIKNASLGELQSVKGINITQAHNIYDYFNK